MWTPRPPRTRRFGVPTRPCPPKENKKLQILSNVVRSNHSLFCPRLPVVHVQSRLKTGVVIMVRETLDTCLGIFFNHTPLYMSIMHLSILDLSVGVFLA